MSLTRLMTLDVVILRAATTTDRNHNVVLDWASPWTEIPAKGWLSQTAAAENFDHRDATVTTAVLYLPAGTDITAVDRVATDDALFDVDGVPHRARTPVGGEHHIEVALRAVEG